MASTKFTKASFHVHQRSVDVIELLLEITFLEEVSSLC